MVGDWVGKYMDERQIKIRERGSDSKMAELVCPPMFLFETALTI